MRRLRIWLLIPWARALPGVEWGRKDQPEGRAEAWYYLRPSALGGGSSACTLQHLRPLCSPRTAQTRRTERPGAAARGATWQLAHTHLKHRGSVPSEATPARALPDPLAPGQRSGAGRRPGRRSKACPAGARVAPSPRTPALA